VEAGPCSSSLTGLESDSAGRPEKTGAVRLLDAPRAGPLPSHAAVFIGTQKRPWMNALPAYRQANVTYIGFVVDERAVGRKAAGNDTSDAGEQMGC
jgi:hypothetical protein